MLTDLLLILLLGPIGILIVIFRHARAKKNVNPGQDKNWYLSLAFSKEDAVSQWFLLLSLFFLGVTLLSLNRDTGEPLTWRTILLISCIAGLAISYYFKTLSTLIFSLLGVVSWWGTQAVQWIDVKDIRSSSILTGLSLLALLLYVLGHYHEKEKKYKRFSVVYSILGIILITVALFLFSSKQGLNILAEMTKGVSFVTSWEITSSLLMFFLSLLGLSLYTIIKKLVLLPEALTVLLLMILFSVIALLPEQNIFINNKGINNYFSSNELSSNGIVWAIIFNLALFFELLGLIFSGYLRREEWLINLGTLFLFILIIVKYFDWLFTFLDKSIFFIGAGVLLFAVGWFMEKSRRYMIANIKPEQKLT